MSEKSGEFGDWGFEVFGLRKCTKLEKNVKRAKFCVLRDSKDF